MEITDETVDYRTFDADAEVSAAFDTGRLVIDTGDSSTAARSGATNTTPQYTIVDMQDRSDDEESDHTPDPYSQHMRGRVSPSPYTANTERARLFNTYVRSIIEQKLDVIVPISHQPRDLITDIIADASARFPEFATCVRKRIRTFLKSYRRSKKIKDGVPVSYTQNGVKATEDGPSLTSPVPPSLLSPHVSPRPDGSPEPHQPSEPPGGTAIVTIVGDTPSSSDDLPPEPKRLKLAPVATPQLSKSHSSSAAVAAASAAVAAASASAAASSAPGLSGTEVSAVQQLISGYRESAAFLMRAANQLEAMLAKDSMP